MRPIRLAFSALLVGMAAVFSGCYGIASETSQQLDVIGDVQISTTTCVDSGAPPPYPTCPNPTASGGSPSPSAFLIAYRVPAGTVAPDTIESTSGSPITFNRDQSYTDSLTGAAAPPSGQVWVGYRSTQTQFGGSTLEPKFKLPKNADGHAFHGPFKYRTVTGWIDDQSANGDDPVVCNTSDPTQPSTPNANNTTAVCIDDPSASEYPTNNEQQTRDLGVVAGAASSVQQNTSGDVPFTIEFAGPVPQTSFSVTATTDAPGVTVTPSTDVIRPAADSSTPITVRADVPPTAPLGNYTVTLKVKHQNGQERTQTAKLTVALGKPVNQANPFINGTDAVGKTVECAPGDWTSSPTKFAYQWVREGADIAGATSASYTLTQDDGARLIACRVVASNDAGDSTAISGVIRIAQPGGADVDTTGKPKVTKNSDGTYTIDPGITLSCPARLPKNCGGSTRLETSDSLKSARAAATRVAKGGFSVQSGAKQKVRLKLSRAASKVLAKKGRLTLVAKVVTRNHVLQRVTSQKRFVLSLR